MGKPAKAKLLSVSVFFHSSLDEWDERSVPEVSKPSEVDYGFLFAVFAEGFLELGFGKTCLVLFTLVLTTEQV